MRYRSQRDDNAEVRSKLRELAQQRRRFGYRRLHILLRREGIVINRKKTQRLYREERSAWPSGIRAGEFRALPSWPKLRSHSC
jgi:hypothetical protein